MPEAAALAHAAQHALLLAVAVSLPVLALAALVGLVVAVLQAMMQVQDPAVSHLPRLLAVVAALAVAGPWMAREVSAFAVQMFAVSPASP
jgi:flagellar biosynthetic protein FliQ